MKKILAPSNQSSLAQFIKYCLVGLLNTGVTALVIWLATRAGSALLVANAIGYVVGIAFSLILNTFFTFGTKLSRQVVVRFLATAGIAYLANLVAIGILWGMLPNEDFWVQAGGMVTYTATGFLLNKFWAMA